MMVHGNLSIPRVFGHPLLRAWVRMRYRRNYQICLPESWDDVPFDQVERVFFILANRESFKVPELELLRAVNDIPDSLIAGLGPEQVEEKLLSRLQWMLTEPLTNPSFDQIKVGNGMVPIPRPQFARMKMDQYCKIDEAYEQLSTTTDRESLLLFLTALMNCDITVAQRIPEGLQYFLLYYYLGSKQWLFTKYLPAEDLKTKPSEKQAANRDWQEVFIDVADRGTLGDYHAVVRTPVTVFFAWLGKNRKQFLAMKQNALQQAIKAQHKKFTA